MDEFLGTIDLNQNGDLIVSSSYLTYSNWSGYIGYLSNNDITNHQDQPLMLSSLKINTSIHDGVCNAMWTSDDQFIVGTDFGQVNLYQIKKTNNNIEDDKFEQIMTKTEHDDYITSIATQLNSKIAITGSEDSIIKIWDLNEQISVNTFEAHDFGITSLIMNPMNPQIFISTSQDGKALLWDTRNSIPAYMMNHTCKGFPNASGWSGLDLNKIALGSETGQIEIYDLRMIKQNTTLFSQKIHDRTIRKIKFNNNITDVISTASEDCFTKTFRIESQLNEIYSYKHGDYVTDLTWASKNEYLTCSWDGFVKRHFVLL